MRGVKESLLLHVRLDQRYPLLRAPGKAEILQRHVIHREDGAGGAVLGRHVSDGGAVRQCQAAQAGPIEFHELADHAFSAEQLGDGEDQISSGGSLGQLSLQPESDDLGNKHRNRLAQHRGFGLDPADTPAQHSQSIDHGRVRVGADQGIGIGLGQVSRSRMGIFVGGKHHPGQVLEVDLVHDPGVGRDHAEVVERPLPPAKELVPFAIPLVIEIDVGGECLGAPEGVHLHRVVDHQLDRLERIDPARIASELRHGIPHGGEIYDRRHAGKILQQDPGGSEGDLAVRRARGRPARQSFDVVPGNGDAIFRAQQILQQDAQRVRQKADIETSAGKRLQPEYFEATAGDR
jgi:hypothetical protein